MKSWPSRLGFARFRFHLLAFVIGTCFISLGGGLYAHYIGFLDPEVFTWYYIVTMLIMVLIGGSGTIAGPVIGAILFTWLPEYLRRHQGLSDGLLWPDPGGSDHLHA